MASVDIKQIILRYTEYGTKCSIFKTTQGCCTQNDHLDKTTPVCEGMFQIWPLGTELWDKMLNFKDNIGLTYYQYNENSSQKMYNPNMDLELDQDPELNPHHHHNHLRWDIDGTRARLDPKFRSQRTTHLYIWSWIQIWTWPTTTTMS